jgi:hypothetical protein
VNEGKLAARTKYENDLATRGGILLEHSVAGFQFREMYCKPKKPMYEITKKERQRTCLSLLASDLWDASVYETDRLSHRGLGKRQSTFEWPNEEMTVKEACLRGAMKAPTSRSLCTACCK